MARIVIVGPSQLSRSPRLVRNADAMAAAGHDVTVVAPTLERAQIDLDRRIAGRAAWRYHEVDLIPLRSSKIRLDHRVVRAGGGALLRRWPVASWAAVALVYGHAAVARAADVAADFYLGQQQAVLPLVARLAMRHGKPYGCDIEDILGESSDEPRELIKAVERRYLPEAAAVCTMSEAAGSYLQRTYDLGTRVTVLHNCPLLSERANVAPPQRRAGRPTIYWFGQTLGPHSCALELLEANAVAGAPFGIRLRGRPVTTYVEALQRRARELGLADDVEILPTLPPEAMVEAAASADILYASQPSDELFHQLAVGNKVFTGLAAGCALLLEDTTAHRVLMERLAPAAVIMRYRATQELAAIIRRLATDRDDLEQRRRAAWDLAGRELHWEHEARRLVEAIEAVVPREAAA